VIRGLARILRPDVLGREAAVTLMPRPFLLRFTATSVFGRIIPASTAVRKELTPEQGKQRMDRLSARMGH